ncbi:hypothetical protein KRM28CT15_49400 [Krasilnikovia sp. M28-CT-15]
MGYVAELQQFDTQPAAEPDPEPTDPYAALADLAPREEQPPGRSAGASSAGHVPAQRCGDFAPDAAARPVSGQAARFRDAWALPEPGAEPEHPRGRFAVPEPPPQHAAGTRRAGGSLLNGGTGGFAWRPGQPSAAAAHAAAPEGTYETGWAPANDAPDWFPEHQATEWRQPEPSRDWRQEQPAGWHAEDQPGWHAEDQPGWHAEDQAGWHAEDQPGWHAEDQAGWHADDQATGWAPAERWQAAAAVPAPAWGAGTGDGWDAPAGTPDADDRDLTVTADRRLDGPPRDRQGATAGHRRSEAEGPHRDRRSRLVLGAAATAVLLGTGMCYAALRGPAASPRAAAPAATASALPSDDALLNPADSGLDAVPAQPTASPKPTTASPTGATPTASRRTGPAGGSSPTGTTTVGPGTALPGAATPGSGTPTPKPTASASSSATASPTPTSLAPLTATFSHTADTGPDGLTDYVGTVRVANPRDRAAGGWRVTLKVPGGNAVDADSAVTVTQDGEKVTFTPAGEATIPAGGSVTFTFTVRGVLTAEPLNCAINGDGCA